MCSNTARLLLVVDDDPGIRESLADLLNDEGYVVMTAVNGQDALRACARAENLPCVILLDLMMPVMSGAEFYDEMPMIPRSPTSPSSSSRRTETRAQGAVDGRRVHSEAGAHRDRDHRGREPLRLSSRRHQQRAVDKLCARALEWPASPVTAALARTPHRGCPFFRRTPYRSRGIAMSGPGCGLTGGHIEGGTACVTAGRLRK